MPCICESDKSISALMYSLASPVNLCLYSDVQDELTSGLWRKTVGSDVLFFLFGGINEA